LQQIIKSSKIFYADLNEIDLNFNSPLLLAVKLRRKDCIRVLCDHLADPHYKPFSHCILFIQLLSKSDDTY